ncbi:MAG: NosD domain-containing protein [Candidatus Thorarchaeota archaeon]
MNKTRKYLQRIACVLGILILTTSMIISTQLTPMAGIEYSGMYSERPGMEERFISSYDTHLPIVITSNSDFVTEGFTGNGAESNPYVLEGYNITNVGICVSIIGTDAYFEIRDCLITGGLGGSGITMNNVVNGKLQNNTIIERNRGIYLYSSSYNNIVVNNSILDSTYGVSLNSALNNSIINNTFAGNNFAGFHLESSSYNNTFVNNTISGGTYGVYSHSSTYNTLLNNTISVSGTGVYLYLSSNNNSIVNNTIFESNYGVRFSSSDINTMVNNMIIDNSNGVYCSPNSDNNLIYHNIIAYSTSGNADDDGTNNQWNTTSSGNFWSDYSAIGVYNISGSANSIDYYPSIYPPDITAPSVDQPSDIEYEEWTFDNEILWAASEEYPSHYSVYRNDIEVYSDSWNGSSILLDVDDLTIGSYNFTIVLYDLFGHMTSDTVIVTVIDSVPPTVSSLGDFEYEMGTTGHKITWTLNDVHPGQFVFLRNGIEIVSGSWSGDNLTLNIDGLSVGVHTYTIRVYDTSGNTGSDTVIVTVTGPHVTNTETATTNTTGAIPSIGTELALVIGILVGGFVVGIIVLIMNRFRKGK